MHKQKINKNAFTLVELIVVITILAILWTIAFISLQWYSRDARDSVRASDVNLMKKSLELYYLDAWKYPTPDNWYIVDYDGDTLWTQWIFWENVLKNLSRNISEIPTDPLTDQNYVYSLANNKSEYEILWLFEWSDLTNLNAINRTNAAETTYIPKVTWNYNWVFLKTTNYIVPTPSIINAEVDEANITLDTNNIKSQVTNKGQNIPSNLWNVISQTWALNIILSPYTGTITKNSTDQEKLDAIQAIKDAYTGSELVNEDRISQILNTTDNEELIALTETIVLNQAWTSVATTTTTNYTCDDTTKPSDNWHITFTIWTPTSENQAYVQDASNCWYNCTDWYTGTSCEIAPNPYASCSSQWELLTATTTFPWCDTADIIVCSWAWAWYTISACNVWTTTASTDWTVSRWQYFQWWRNKWFAYWDITQQPTQIANASYDSNNDTYWFVWNSNLSSYRYDWIVNQDDNLWWDNSWAWTDEQRQWPCPTWYHVPSQTEWSGIVSAWDGVLWDISWTTTEWTNLQTALKLPYAGGRNRGNGSFVNGGSNGYYWSSSPNGTGGYSLSFNSSYVNPSRYDYRANGFSVRCFKN